MTVMELDQKRFNELVNHGEKPVLVDFWAPWCVYCRRIAPAYEKIAQQYADRLLVAKVNIDDVPDLALGSIVAPESKARIDEFLAEHLL